jgi:hypothetical protein
VSTRGDTEKLLRRARKAGLTVEEASRHVKVRAANGDTWTVSRGNHVNRHRMTVGFVKWLRAHDVTV